MVKSTITPHIKTRYWCTLQGRAGLKELYKDLPDFEDDARRGGFVNGRPMLNPSIPILTCTGSARPRILYRVVHNQQPHYGRKARGYGIVKITPLLFKMLVDKHLNWKCRQPSPFMSTTDSWVKVRTIARTLQEHGYKGIQVIKFKSSGPGWDHESQRLFYAPNLIDSFRTRGYWVKPYMKDDYLLESHIPPQSIRKVKDIKDVSYEPVPRISKKREAPEDSEERKSSKRSKNFMREKRA